jgi:hypothetical protein
VDKEYGEEDALATVVSGLALLLIFSCRVRFFCNNCTFLARQRVDCVFVDKEYGEEDTLATVVSGLVLGGCLLVVVTDHHPIVVVRSGVARTLPARQQERAKQCHPVDGGWRSREG